MKFSQLASPAWALFLTQAAATPRPERDTVVDVAIIGGGSAGIHAAIQLKDAGATFAVIEKKSQIGGHAETWTNPKTGIPANVGVVLFENTEVVSNYFSRLNVSIVKTNPLSTAGPSKSYDFSLGFPIPAQNASATAAQQQALQAAAQAYSTNVLAKYPWIDQGYLVPDPVPEELTIPFGELAQKYNFTALLTVIAQFNWYTGDISTIPALYGIKGLGPALLNNIFGQFIVSGNGDTRALYNAAANELGDSVLLNANVVEVKRDVKIDKHTTGVTVLVQQPNQPPKLIRARKLLVAIPPTLKNVGTYDLTAEERTLFSKFGGLGYWAGVATIPGLNISLTNVGVQTTFNQPVIPGTNGFNSYGSPGDFLVAVGFHNTDYTTADAQAILRKNLATLAAVGGVPKDAAETVTFPFSSDHGPYNLRVSAEEIKAGFYGKFLALEGKRNTYWAGAVFTGHNSGLVWNFNEGTVLPALKKGLGL
ncbi:flavin-containing superfamily amine oxidase [Colletotrichum tofieldiae]|uniref:Flavin-containing superfamily amine oxidase n=1 Tax=Colletotrichum tofieldiae TaxID=708197 RepID=A0A166QQH5_9PEZI|nr:flavin-containing superfamily amine oxidase [Colletotrichum tofieldiae]GKT55252.1 flavin-containing superfamily amine oxidase [Colletotrichum tofieldiae]GKT75459.1 flavin-containing superfamily amine oxidase [Colletotrichum tofieldiae]